MTIDYTYNMKKVDNKTNSLQIKKEMWSYILGFYQDNQVSPTYQEIADYFNGKYDRKHGREWVRYYVKQLVKERKITVSRFVNRSIKPVIK